MFNEVPDEIQLSIQLNGARINNNTFIDNKIILAENIDRLYKLIYHMSYNSHQYGI